MATVRVASIQFKAKGKAKPKQLSFRDVEGLVIPGEHFVVLQLANGQIAFRESDIELVTEGTVEIADDAAPAALLGPDGQPLAPAEPPVPAERAIPYTGAGVEPRQPVVNDSN